MIFKDKHIHFIGIGGISLSSLAALALSFGAVVSGSDISLNEQTENLEKSGAKIYNEHNAKNVFGADVVVYSSAIKEDNTELKEAKFQKILVLKRAEFLSEISKEYKTVIAVAGSHGKTTTTAMISKILIDAGVNPTVHIGGDYNFIGGNYCIGSKEYFVTEACEYKDNFLYLTPKISVILNIAPDHLDYFKTLENIKLSFFKFAQKTQKDGFIVANADEKCIKLPFFKKKFKFSAENKGYLNAANIRQEKDGSFSFCPIVDGAIKPRIKLGVFGQHNIYNALASIMVCLLLNIDLKKIGQSLKTFYGVKRRFEKVGKINGANIIIDYAHHPEEIEKSIKTAKILTKGQVFAVFQPHTYSRTASLFNDFIYSLKDADERAYYTIFPAREEPMPGITHTLLAQKSNELKLPAYAIDNEEDLYNAIMVHAKPENTIILLGAGDFVKIVKKLPLRIDNT